MKKLSKKLICIVLAVLLSACDRELDDGDIVFCNNNEHIKAQSSVDGEISYQYFYDRTGRLVETSSSKLVYDKHGRLVRHESFAYGQRFSLYTYDRHGRISKFETFRKLSEKDQYMGMLVYEYEGLNIVRVNYYCDNNNKNHINVYTFDDRGNIVNIKYYNCVGHSEPKLIDEISYKHDNYKNPFRVMSAIGITNLFPNVNNIIEETYYHFLGTSYTIVYEYEYNSNGYPVKVRSSRGDWIHEGIIYSY